jgi:hypothetical protein
MFTLLSERSPGLLTLTVAYSCCAVRAVWELACLCSIPAWNVRLDDLSEGHMNISWRSQHLCIHNSVLCYLLFLPILNIEVPTGAPPYHLSRILQFIAAMRLGFKSH